MDLFKVEKRGDFTVVYLSGRLDIVVVEEIEDRLNKLLEDGVTKIVIDLGDVEYFSSSAMRVLIAIKRLIDEKKGILRLCRTSKMVDKIMSALELIKVFEIYKTVDDATSVD